MALSMFDKQLFEFACKCGEVEPIVLGRLDNVSAWTCRLCGSVTNLDAEPYRSGLADLREVATELDKQARQRGEVIKRID